MSKRRPTPQSPGPCNAAVTRKRVVGLGEILWDVYPEGKFLGGAPANFAFHVQYAGHEGFVVSRVGRDEFGDEIVEKVSLLGLETRWIQRDTTHPTGTVRVTLNDKGVPSFQCTANVAFDYLKPAPEWQTLTPGLDGVLFGSLAQRNDVSRAAIQEFVGSAKTSFKVYDINIRGWSDETRSIVHDSLVLANAAKLNDEELNTLRRSMGREDLPASEFVRFLLEEFKLELIALTLGERGCVLDSGKEVVYSPGFSVEVEDTTGAGDAFAAGLIVKLLEGHDLRETAEFANGLGALVSTRKGATPGWNPTELRRLMAIRRSRIWDDEFRQFG